MPLGLIPRLPRPPARFRALSLACLLGMLQTARAATYTVTTEAELRQAILDINAASGAQTIDIQADITLTASLPPITNTVTIRGNNSTLDGAGQYQLLVLGDPGGAGPRILAQVRDLSLVGGLARGGDGSSGGGGGLGAGGAVMVGSRADVLLTNVTVEGGTAVGGDGGAGLGGSGGELNSGPAVGLGAGGDSTLAGTGGSGSFGGGGGAGPAAGGAGGGGGGSGGVAGGGGGAGLGGGIFVADGGSLSIGGNSSESFGAAVGGLGTGGGGNGTGAGQGMFLAGSGTLQLRVSPGQGQVIKDSIADSVGAGLLPASSQAQWNVLVLGSGYTQLPPLDSLNRIYGRVELDAPNAFAGDLYVNAADVAVGDQAALGQGGVSLNDGGLYLAAGMTLTRDVALEGDGGRIGVELGQVVQSGVISGSGNLDKVGAGNLVLAGSSSGNWNWRVVNGALVLDSDARLGSASLTLLGGGVVMAADVANFRSFSLGSSGYIDNGGHAVTLTGVTDWGVSLDSRDKLTFRGSGTTTLAGAQVNTGDTIVESGRVVGAIATGGLTVQSGGTYAVGGTDRTVTALDGSGNVELDGGNLTIWLKSSTGLGTHFDGHLSGSGGLVVRGSPLDPYAAARVQDLGAGNTYSGGTTVMAGALLAVTDDSSLGSGGVLLQGGSISFASGTSNRDLQIDGEGVIRGSLVMNGVISGTGTLVKYDIGTLTLNSANTYVGDTLVDGTGAYLVLANPAAIGSGVLKLSNGGGLRLATDTAGLRPIEIVNGVGVVDIGSFDVQSVGGITGLAADSTLRKEGSGRLLLTGTLDLAGGAQVAAGTLQVGNGGSGGDITGNVDIAGGARLVIDRDGTLTLAGNLTGSGAVDVIGPGTVTFAPATANNFLGGLTVRNGVVGAASDQGLGFGAMLLDDNGGLLLQGNIDRNVDVGAGGGRLLVDGSNTFTFAGDVSQAGGLLTKAGTGTLVLTGVAGDGGNVRVAAGTLQVGSGFSGNLASDVAVDAGATLVFGRDDLVQYAHVISGAGTVIKRGTGDLVLTADQVFAGTFQVESGNLRVGLGGTSGALNGNVDLAAGSGLIFDRSDTLVFSHDTSGAGRVQKNGPGLLVVTGTLDHTGGTSVTSGDLAIGNGGTSGSISGDVSLVLGSRLVVNRSDDLLLGANVSGAGVLVQAGSGTTVLTGSNTQTGGVLITGGRLGVDSDARLGAGELVMDGGLLRYEAAFGDLRAIAVRAGGGGLDTNGLDVGYGNQVSGSGVFTKAGAGRLTVTGLLGTDVRVESGELRIGDGGSAGLLAGNAWIGPGATLSLDRADFAGLAGGLSGSGDVRQIGGGELRLAGNFSAYTGNLYVDNGYLRLDGTVGGNVTLAPGTWMQGNAAVLGNLDATLGTLRPGNSPGVIAVGGNLLLGPGSTTEIDVDADGQHDRLAVTGTAYLDGTLRLLPLAGDYTQPGCCSYTILTAGAISGTFATVSNDLVFLDTQVTYHANDVVVAFTRNNVAFNTVSLTWNQQQVATAIDALEAASPSNPLVGLMTPLDPAQARTAFDGLSGDSVLVAVTSSTRTAARFAQLLQHRGSRLGMASRGGRSGDPLADLGLLLQGRQPEAPPAPAAGFAYDGPTSRVEGVWAEMSALSLDESADADVGSASGHLQGNLLALGSDGYWRDELLLGLAAGTLDGNLSYDNRGASGTATGTFAGVYGRWDSGAGLQYKGALTVAQQDSELKRTVVLGTVTERSQATVATRTLGVALEAGLPLHVASVGLRPHVLVNAQASSQDAVTESGGSPAALTGDAGNALVGEFGVGLELSRPWLTGAERWAQVNGGLTLLQPFGDTQREQTFRFSGGGAPFTVKSTPDDSAALGLSLGAEFYLGPGLALWGGYEGRVSATSQEHNGVLSMQYRW